MNVDQPEQETPQAEQPMTTSQSLPADGPGDPRAASQDDLDFFTGSHPMQPADWKVVVAEHFPELVPPVAACIATACSLILSDLSNCPALVLVGQPSSSKTTILEFIDPSFVYLSDNFTPRAFVTHAATIKKAELEKIDLLPRFKHKLWMVKDLAPIFS